MRTENNPIFQDICKNPIIFAVKNDAELHKSLNTPAKVLFLLGGNILTIRDNIDLAKKAGKTVLVHIDLIEGLTPQNISVDWLHQLTKADGIISTKPRILKYARKLGLFTILRIFALDSRALENAAQNVDVAQPDMLEVLPGVAVKQLNRRQVKLDIPIIGGGLIVTEQDVLDVLKSGATAISSSNLELVHLLELFEAKNC